MAILSDDPDMLSHPDSLGSSAGADSPKQQSRAEHSATGVTQVRVANVRFMSCVSAIHPFCLLSGHSSSTPVALARPSATWAFKQLSARLLPIICALPQSCGKLHCS